MDIGYEIYYNCK
jgi:hypothetical protein